MNSPAQLTLGTFLRTKRAQLSPAVAAVAARALGHRRVVGLRREEVAQLAGVSVTWYTLLEQDRARSNPSGQVLRSLARALQLSPTEEAHLFDLAGQRAPAPPAQEETVTPVLLQLLKQQLPHPAFVVDRYWNVVGWNRATARVFVDYDHVAAAERNVVYQYFVGRTLREQLSNWRVHAQGLLGPLRADYARYRDDSGFIALISRLQQASHEFASWWPDHAITSCYEADTLLQHRQLGELRLAQTVCAVYHSNGLQLILYTAMDAQTSSRLATALDEAPRS